MTTLLLAFNKSENTGRKDNEKWMKVEKIKKKFKKKVKVKIKGEGPNFFQNGV